MATSNLINMNGTIVPAADAKIHVLSPAAKYGATVFEGICGYWSEGESDMYVFRLREHLDRLIDSIRIMRIDCTLTPEFFADAVLATMRANGYNQDVHIRLSVWVAGEGAMDSAGPADWMCAVLPRPERTLDSRAAAGAVSSWRRIDDTSMPPRVKSAANYNNGRLAQMQARADGYDEALLLGPDGKVSEGTGACFFMIRGGMAVTPPVTSGILESVTRATLLELLPQIGIGTIERPIDRTELYVAEEAFLCGSGYEITPLVSIDRHAVGSGAVGPLTRRLWEAYDAVVRGRGKAPASWLRPVGSSPATAGGHNARVLAASEG